MLTTLGACPRTFAHLARWAAAIRLRADNDMVRFLRRPLLDGVPELIPTTPLSAVIALSNCARSCFNCSSTATRSVIGSLSFWGRLDYVGGSNHTRGDGFLLKSELALRHLLVPVLSS